METDAIHRYQSRIFREMSANRVNPGNSPPSSTGSHGTVTVSTVFSDLDGESTRRLKEDIARISAPRKLPIDWEAAHRKWPEHFTKPKDHGTVSSDHHHSRRRSSQNKENKPPISDAKFTLDDTTREIWPGTDKTRAEMQPRVDNESDISSVLDKSPVRPASVFGTTKPRRQKSPLSKTQTRISESAARERRHSSVAEVLGHVKRASPSPETRARDSPNGSSLKSSLTAVSPTSGYPTSPGHNTSHLPSFFAPDFSYLGDFVTGTLKFSGSIKNGVPILVKHGKVHDRHERPAAGAHDQVDGIKLPKEEEKIFVSMDEIRQEIVSLQAAHDKVLQYAEDLQLQVERLEAQLRHGKGHHGYDESEKYMAQTHRLELQVASLQTRLDEASRSLSANEIKTEAIAHERDRAIARLQEACEDISKLTRKLSVREKELSTSQKQLESSDQARQDNDTLRRNLASLKHSRDDLELENSSLRSQNESLRREQLRLREEVELLRSNNKSSRNSDAISAENRTLRSSHDLLIQENEDLRENLDGVQHELDAVREEVESLRAEVVVITREKSTVQQDNESLVRQNEKYFGDNKVLRRENTGFERSVHDLHGKNVKLQEEVDFLKQQLDHCRPPHNDGNTAPTDEETEDHMNPAYFVPDMTVKSGDTQPVEATEEKHMPAMPDITSHGYTTERETREITRRSTENRQRSRSRAGTGPKGVAFSIPEKSSLRSKTGSNVANRGSKRRQGEQSSARAPSTMELDLTNENDDTTGGFQSDDLTNQDAAISLNISMKDGQFQPRDQDVTGRSHTSRRGSQSRAAQRQHVLEVDLTNNTTKRSANVSTRPALSTDARRVLDGLCVHNCRNCIVCSRITSHRSVAVSAAEAASGKKRVSVPRPVPVTERNLTGAGDDQTMRPSQSPGHALALVIKGLRDENEHMQLRLTRLQADYNGSDKALGRRDRRKLAESIETLLKRVEVKSDQIYSLYDVLEGQKAAGQAMTEEELEMTVLHITGMTVRDVTAGSEQLTWEGIPEPAVS